MTELAKRILFAVPAALFFLYLVWMGGSVLFLFLLILSLLGLIEMARMFSRIPSGLSLPTVLFASLYVPAGFFFFWKLRQAGESEAGLWLALSLLLMIWANDIFAYLGGRQFGRRPLAPKISPKKTWEGFWSGFLGSVSVMVLIVFFADNFPLSILEALPLVGVVACLGPTGDLMISRLKRLASLKDSSRLFPGHGGILDRFDSLLLSAPFFYLYVIWFV